MQNNRRGLLIVISGPSGVGKGVICKGLIENNEAIKMSVSATTRAPRKDEIDGVNYFFKTREAFEEMIKNNEFLEYVDVFGTNYYGTPRAYVEDELSQGHDIILEIDVQGAMRVKDALPDAVTVFIAPPSMSVLKTRLIGRGTESEESIERRFEEAFCEMQCIPKYDYVVINSVLLKAISDIESIISAERLRVYRNKDLSDKIMGGMKQP